MKKCHGRLHYDRKFQIFTSLIGYINVNKGVLGLIISYLRIKSYNVFNYNNCSTDWSFPLTYKKKHYWYHWGPLVLWWWPSSIFNWNKICKLCKGQSNEYFYPVWFQLTKWFWSRWLKCEKFIDEDGCEVMTIFYMMDPSGQVS